MPDKVQLWVIAIPGTSQRFSDDKGGDMFTSPEMARRTFHKYADCLKRVGAVIQPCDLDDDLAQMGQLYHEDK